MKKEAMLYEKLYNKKVRCNLCSHRCKVADSKFGICRVRQNIDGHLYTLVYGETIAENVDPIEKKPLFHFLPGSSAYSIATVGCNFKCAFCQNWQISQVSEQGGEITTGHQLMPEQIVENARRHNCKSIAYTYTEPTIFFEYAYDTAILAKEAGLANIFITNGFMTRQALDTISPYLDAANVDLKSFREGYYKRVCEAHLQPVVDSITYMKELGIWVEVTTLLVPRENDSDDELNDIADFIAKLDTNIPWHISRFHPKYKFVNHASTSIESLHKARDIGKKHGLRYVYLGNVAEGSDTYCHNCNELLVKRSITGIERSNITQDVCPSCGAKISGVWQ